MSTFTTITVPDIGDFKHIPVIEILVKGGDRVFQGLALGRARVG
jgi:pyruvate/2-oxoglutarate dehydrogenase complex dihydrolipoamide acyltransferase (E2) component